jgi:hypothetical protein
MPRGLVSSSSVRPAQHFLTHAQTAINRRQRARVYNEPVAPRTSLPGAAGLAAAAVAGGAVALGGAAAVGELGGTTTITQVDAVPVEASALSAPATTRGLSTARSR